MRATTAALAALAAAAALLAVPAAAKAPPSRLLITAREYSLVLSHAALPRGRAIAQLVDRGQDAHDLVLHRLDHGRPVGPGRHVPETSPGAVSTVHWRLRPGRYALWCTLPGHRRLGMHARLRVRRRRSTRD
jgi:hypothetical protein